jgi:hypothetical protein
MIEKELKELGESGKTRRESAEEAALHEIMEKHHVC